MNLRDLFEADETTSDALPNMSIAGYQDPAQDNFGSVQDSDTHTPRLSLKVINDMKKVMQAKKLEADRRKELMAVMYAAPPSEEG